MAAVDVRDLDPADLDAALRVRSLSFGPMSGGGAEAWKARHTAAIAERRVLAAYVGGRVAAMARINPYRQWWHGRDLPMGGVAGVVVGPEHRGRGVGSALMTGLIARLRELGYPLSALYPATVPVYRSLGWELTGRQYRISVPAAPLRTLARSMPDPVPVRRAVAGDGPAIVDLIDARHRTDFDHGPLAYAVTEWEDDLREDEDVAVYLADDGVVAYDWNGDGTLHVSHFSARSERTARTLWALVGSGSSMVTTVTADVAPDEPLARLLPDLGVTTSRDTWWMMRLLDPVAAFAGRGYPPGVSAEVDLELVDPQLPELDGRWRLRVNGGTGALVRDAGRGGGSAPRYTIGPRGLAAMFAGTRISVLRRSGAVDGGSPEGDAALDAVLTGNPFLIDYF